MIEIRNVGKRIEAWRDGVFIFNGSDMAFCVQQAFVRDGVVKVNGFQAERPRKQRRERPEWMSRKAER